MTHFNIVTIFPNLFTEFFASGIVGQAHTKEKVTTSLIDPRSYTTDKHQSVDSPPYGGGDGMLMKASPLAKSIENLQSPGKVIYLSPQGRVWNNDIAKQYAKEITNMTLICGRYAGVDQRFINTYVDEEISIGDYVLSGGETAAMVLVDSILRFVPGILGDASSAEKDTFADHLLETPQFTKPRDILGQAVPEVLVSGHHKNIQAWSQAVAMVKTYFKRNDLLLASELSSEEINTAKDSLSKYSNEELAVMGFNISEVKCIKDPTKKWSL